MGGTREREKLGTGDGPIHSARARKTAGRNDFDEGNESGVHRLAGRENGAPGWECVQSKRPRAAWKRHAGSYHEEIDRTVR